MENVLKNAGASKAITSMYLNEQFSDVHFTFEFDGEIESVPANKGVLALSPVFYAMFFGSLKEGNEVKIEDSDVDAFKEFLQIFYLSEVTLTMENIETVVRLADKYDVLEYINSGCVEFVKGQLRSDDVCWAYKLAMNLQNEELMECCERIIIKSAKQVMASDVFNRCDRSFLKQILTLDLLCSEVDIFDACLKWAKRECEQNGLDAQQAVNWRIQLGDCLKLIRFGLMTYDEFSKRYMLFEGFFTSDELEDIILMLMVAEHESKIFNQLPRLEWNGLCQRNIVSSAQRLTGLRDLEVASFSSSHQLMLKEIHTAIVYNGSYKAVQVEITITESDDFTFQSNQPPKILYQETTTMIENRLNLPESILIRPDFMYEVRLGSRSIVCTKYYADCQPMVVMGAGIRIKFHRNPTLNYDNLASSWISALVFNRISE